MKKQNLFISTFLIGMGLYFLLQSHSVPMLSSFRSWPTILMILGASFLTEAFIGRKKDHIFPGVLILGFGIHYHGLLTYEFWFQHWSIYLLIIGLAFFFKNQGGRKLGILLLIISGLFILLQWQPVWFQSLPSFSLEGISLLPLLLIGFGLYLLFLSK
ncbi:hypothetical protein GWK91_08190 [Virgibacillus sp. MSP4-1]|uniref:LiaI-LiaF-like domain-containing protein n=1 Tax=Virgibacillus sp. MSP4-1 TaxID=2700081 RepID=UPI00039BD4D8|nr:DUF5668 domain-containing protein [Virgibacillus sp. MSP4-1]QHS22926.1 hypothetical protein GWK91_08190 [Virgibacillus sp. MSP4-1]